MKYNFSHFLTGIALLIFYAHCILCQDSTEEASCEDALPNCHEETNKCFKKKYRSEMFQHCRKTCRLCVPPGYENYFRNDESLERMGVARAPSYLGFTAKGERQKRQVERGGRCGDLGPDCLVYPNYCTNQYYISFMMDHCPLSCGYCPTTTTGGTCNDVVQECQELNRIGFCESDEQPVAIKRTLCAATCRLCFRFSVTSLNGTLLIGSETATTVSTPAPILSTPTPNNTKPALVLRPDNTVCFDRDTEICSEVKRKCDDVEFFDYLNIYCPVTCNFCNKPQRDRQTGAAARNRNRRALQERLRNRNSPTQPECVDRYESCDELLSTPDFCENTSGRFLCRASCTYCRPTLKEIHGGSDRPRNPIQSRRGLTFSSNEGTQSERNRRGSDEFTELLIPGKEGGKPFGVVRIPKEIANKIAKDIQDDSENGSDGDPEEDSEDGSDDIGDNDIDLDQTLQSILALRRIQPNNPLGTRRDHTRLLSRIPPEIRPLISSGYFKRDSPLPITEIRRALQRRRLIDSLIREANGNNSKDLGENGDKNSEENSGKDATIELPLTESLEAILPLESKEEDEKSEEGQEDPENETQENSPAPGASNNRRFIVIPSDEDDSGNSNERPQNSSAEAQNPRRTIILINNGIQTVQSPPKRRGAQTRPRRQNNRQNRPNNQDRRPEAENFGQNSPILIRLPTPNSPSRRLSARQRPQNQRQSARRNQNLRKSRENGQRQIILQKFGDNFVEEDPDGRQILVRPRVSDGKVRLERLGEIINRASEKPPKRRSHFDSGRFDRALNGNGTAKLANSSVNEKGIVITPQAPGLRHRDGNRLRNETPAKSNKRSKSNNKLNPESILNRNSEAKPLDQNGPHKERNVKKTENTQKSPKDQRPKSRNKKRGQKRKSSNNRRNLKRKEGKISSTKDTKNTKIPLAEAIKLFSLDNSNENGANLKILNDSPQNAQAAPSFQIEKSDETEDAGGTPTEVGETPEVNVQEAQMAPGISPALANEQEMSHIGQGHEMAGGQEVRNYPIQAEEPHMGLMIHKAEMSHQNLPNDAEKDQEIHENLEKTHRNSNHASLLALPISPVIDPDQTSPEPEGRSALNRSPINIIPPNQGSHEANMQQHFSEGQEWKSRGRFAPGHVAMSSHLVGQNEPSLTLVFPQGKKVFDKTGLEIQTNAQEPPMTNQLSQNHERSQSDLEDSIHNRPPFHLIFPGNGQSKPEAKESRFLGKSLDTPENDAQYAAGSEKVNLEPVHWRRNLNFDRNPEANLENTKNSHILDPNPEMAQTSDEKVSKVNEGAHDVLSLGSALTQPSNDSGEVSGHKISESHIVPTQNILENKFFGRSVENPKNPENSQPKGSPILSLGSDLTQLSNDAIEAGNRESIDENIEKIAKNVPKTRENGQRRIQRSASFEEDENNGAKGSLGSALTQPSSDSVEVGSGQRTEKYIKNLEKFKKIVATMAEERKNLKDRIERSAGIEEEENRDSENLEDKAENSEGKNSQEDEEKNIGIKHQLMINQPRKRSELGQNQRHFGSESHKNRAGTKNDDTGDSDENEDGSFDWQSSKLGSTEIGSESFESSLFPLLEKKPWRPTSGQLKELVKKENQEDIE
ncbi:shK domain-like domain-containing protein [Ditylenchus destructor]|uniref:ShK domain-like domain-containing protein n=1 Tax=Ditylenchus destructor TaxID=166010 RepID=A0AAD4N176_9BILA|nr:shK domain-like domain-containing protein [Ditylenchus destructor]